MESGNTANGTFSRVDKLAKTKEKQQQRKVLIGYLISESFRLAPHEQSVFGGYNLSLHRRLEGKQRRVLGTAGRGGSRRRSGRRRAETIFFRIFIFFPAISLLILLAPGGNLISREVSVGKLVNLLAVSRRKEFFSPAF